MSILAFLLIGLLAGWIAGNITRGHGFGVVTDIVLGMVGAVIGGYLFDLLGVTAYGFTGSLVMAIIGAVILLFFAGLLRPQRRY